MYGLYLHIPFCVRKCLYCDFYSLEARRGSIASRLERGHDAGDNRRFMDALEAELKTLPEGFAPSTIFIGGGTPTELNDADFSRLMELVRCHAVTPALQEWTCESNPGTLGDRKIRLMREAGVTRVSLGVQSFDPRTLEFLGRIHSAEEAVEGFQRLRAAGFDNLNLDFIFGVPGTRPEVHIEDARKAVALGPDHVSLYGLMFEEGTPLYDLSKKGFVRPVEGDAERMQYDGIRAVMEEGGYAHYELSNFSRPGRACLHNRLYWSGGDYIGCGPSAHSHWEGARWGNARNLEAYCAALLSGGHVREGEERLDPEAKARETLTLYLRLTEGVPLQRFREQTGYDALALCGDALERFEAMGVLRRTADRLALTEEGLFVSNAVFSELV